MKTAQPLPAELTAGKGTSCPYKRFIRTYITIFNTTTLPISIIQHM